MEAENFGGWDCVAGRQLLTAFFMSLIDKITYRDTYTPHPNARTLRYENMHILQFYRVKNFGSCDFEAANFGCWRFGGWDVESENFLGWD